jgi:hypothetical protein
VGACEPFQNFAAYKRMELRLHCRCGFNGLSVLQVGIFGSAQELVETRILGCFLKNDEFGLGDRHALGL